MMRRITEIPATIFKQSTDLHRQYRVAAYCRVSTDKEEQENSLENQITYYKNKIESTTNWTLVDIFADFGISGMNDKNRIEFQRMIEMCNKGKIDLIITKSISRFARNTVDCLTHVRKLKANNIGVIFEKEGINTLDAVSETFLTWFSAFAQAESESLRNILKETEDREFYVNKIHAVESQITEVNEKLKYAVSPDDAMMKYIEKIIDSTDLNMNEYFDKMVRKVIESVTIISLNKAIIKYEDNMEVSSKL